jgi:hypothetical protein
MQKLLFAEEGAVYNLVGSNDRAFITKLKPFDTTQEINIPEDYIFFDLPIEINEKIYYYCFLNALKDRNYEAAYFYATHVSTFLTSQIYRHWFENPNLDLDFDSPADFQIMCAEIRCYITFASLIFDVYSERTELHEVYPIKLEFVSRFKRLTNPISLARIPDPCSFVDNHISFNVVEIQDPMLFATNPGTALQTIQIVNMLEDENVSDEEPVFQTIEAPVFQNQNYLEFRKGPLNADFCLVDGQSIGAGIIQVKRLIHPCIFLEIYDCRDDPWVNLENYTTIQNSKIWNKFQEFLQFTIDSNLALFFQVAPTNTFVTLE